MILSTYESEYKNIYDDKLKFATMKENLTVNNYEHIL